MVVSCFGRQASSNESKTFDRERLEECGEGSENGPSLRLQASCMHCRPWMWLARAISYLASNISTSFARMSLAVQLHPSCGAVVS